MPKGKFSTKRASERKKLVTQVPSSPDTIEDEDLIVCSKGKTRSDCKIPSFETTSDQENAEFEFNEAPNSDVENEMSKMLEMFESDLNKTMLAKKRKIENFTNAAMDINQSKLIKLWNNQNKIRENLVKEFGTNINSVLKQMETDMTHQKEQEEKVQKVLQQQIKVIDQTRASHMQRMSSLREIHESLLKGIENLEKKDMEQMQSMKEEMRQEMLLLQKRTLMENQQQEMLNDSVRVDHFRSFSTLSSLTPPSSPLDLSLIFPSSMAYLICYAILLCFVPFLFVRISQFAKLFWALKGIPGPPAIPLIGNVILYTTGNSELYRLLKLCNKVYGSMFQLWIGQRPFVFLFRAEVVQPLLSSTQHIDKSSEYIFLQPWLGTGLITSSGAKWHSRRKLLTNTLHKSVLEGYLSLMCQESDILVDRLGKLIDPQRKCSEIFDMVHYAKLCSLNATCKTIMGISAHEQSESEYVKYVSAIERITSILHQRFLTPWLRPELLFNISSLGREHARCIEVIQSFSDKVIKERKEERLLQKKMNMIGNLHIEQNVVKIGRRKALLDLLLELSENGENLSNQDIQEEVDTFMFVGHDTISSCFSWTMYLLGHHPEIQDKVVEEIREILGEKLSRGEEVSLHDLNLLEYLERCIKETLRLFPVIPLIGRDLKSPLKIKNHTLIPGTTVVVATYILHRDPKVFPNPEKFDPDRFCNSNSGDRNPYCYAPFSAGSRNCIGQKFAMMEVKLMLVKVLHNFEVSSVDKRRDLRLQGELVLNNRDGVRIIISRHKKNNNYP